MNPGQHHRWSFALVLVLAAVTLARSASAEVALVKSELRVHGDPAEAVLVLRISDQVNIAGVTVAAVAEGPPGIEFAPVEELARHEKGGEWLVKATIRGLKPGSTMERYVKATVALTDGAPIVRTLAYSLASPSPGMFVIPPQLEVGIEPSGLIPFSIAAGETPLGDVTLAQPLMVERVVKTTLQVQLCAEDGSGCDQPHAVAAHQPLALSLRIPPEAKAGSYVGPLTLAAAGNAVQSQITLTLHVSSRMDKGTGVLVVVLGVVCAFFVTVVVRFWINRNRTLLPFAMLREKLDALAKPLDKDPFKALVSRTPNKIESLREQITDKQLRAQQILPGMFPDAFAQVALTSAKTLVDKVAGELAALERIVEGMKQIFEEAIANPSPRVQEEVEEQIGILDKLALSDDPPSADQIEAAVKAALAAVEQAASAGRAEKAQKAAGGFREAFAGPSFEQLTVQIDALNGFAWLVFVLVTVVVGIGATVLKSGFGTDFDYIACFLWGFGAPLTAANLATLSPKIVAASLGISVPQ